MDRLNSVRVVLVRPRGSANVGSVARAMANTGLRHLVLVEPCEYLCDEAFRMALRARPLLEEARVTADLREAIAEAAFVVGTSCRLGQERGPTETPRALAPKILKQALRAPAAVVFGPEDRGLTNDELSLCQERLTIPSHPGFPSLNLAQAVMIVCYELYAGLQPGGPALPERSPAPSRSLEEFYAQMESTLNRIRFLNPQNPGHIMRTLRRIFARALPDEREVRILRGIFHQVDWYIATGGKRGWKPPPPPSPSSLPDPD